jgi:fluoride ion exporter CrcB/FEX
MGQLGSFLMGWFGIIFKADIRQISDHLIVGITTGYMGSLTTFSGWNQKMIVLSSKGHWVYAIAGIVLGIFIICDKMQYVLHGNNRNRLHMANNGQSLQECSLSMSP